MEVHFLLPIPRQYVEHPSEEGREYVRKALRDLAQLWVEKGEAYQANLTISGYDFDPRQLYEIQEVCDWARMTLEELPALPFFLTRISVVRLVGWVGGPVSKEEVYSSGFQKEHDIARSSYLKKAISSSTKLLKEAGADAETISKLRQQVMRTHTFDSGRD